MLMSPVRNEFIAAGGLRFHWIQWGEHGAPIVCVTGITANAFCFQALADDLARDHRLIAYDLRGRGDSDKPEHGYSVAIHAEDLAQLIDAWGLDHPVVVGHSMGAFIALYLAAHHPGKLSKLVLIDAGASLPWKTIDERPAWLNGSLGRLGTPVPSFEQFTQLLKLAPFLGPYWNDYLLMYFDHDVRRNADGSVVPKTSRKAALEDLQYEEEAMQPEQLWSSVNVPTLLLRAGQGLFSATDQLLPEEKAAAIQRAIKDCRYVNFPTLNHYTIIFGVEGGPAREIRSFVEDEAPS